MKFIAKLLLIASLAAPTIGTSATINWTNFLAPDSDLSGVIDPGVFSTEGSLVVAENIGGAATSFDGIPFAEGTTELSAGTFVGYYNGNAGNELFNSGSFGAATTLDLDVVVGQAYLVELVFADARAGFSEGKTITVDTEDPAIYGISADPFPVRVFSGTFIADSPLQAISFTVTQSNGSPGGSEFNGYQLRAIPEPSSVALLGLFGLTLLGRRRR